MKAAVLTGINQPLQVSEVENCPLVSGQVRVRMHVSGICGSQLHEIGGYKGNARFLPHLMGHEGFGVVEEIGLGVTKVKANDHVVLHWRPGNGIESDFPSYVFENRLISSGKVTTLAEVVTVSENRVTKVPPSTNPQFGALLGCSLSTSFGLIERESGLMFGESVLVIGCGGVGINVISAAKLRGAGKIVGVDKSASKESLVRTFGADEFYNSVSDLSEEFDLIIDTTGSEFNFSSAIHFLGKSGRFFIVGQPKPGTQLVVPDGLKLFNGQGHLIRATQGGSSMPDIDIPRYLKLFENGRINIEKLITHSFRLDNINEAFDILKTGSAGRILIEF